MKPRLSEERVRRMAGRCRRPAPDDDPPADFWWRLRYYAALRSTCYLTIRIDQPHLRMRVVEHVAVCWWRCCCLADHLIGLDGLFQDYCRDVERDVDRKARDTSWELHRVWTNHAVMLGGQRDEVCWRPIT